MKKTLFTFMALAMAFAVTSCQSEEELPQEPTNDLMVTTGTAKANIGENEVDVNWVQLWAGGPKFAEKNVGATSATDQGTTMSFGEATKAGAEYVWGANWCTPSKEDMEHLMTAAKGKTDDKVKCEYTQEGSQYGFKFTGKDTGYTDNSVFFPAQNGNSYYGDAYYWSATADGSKAWDMFLYYFYGDWFSDWYSDGQDAQGNCRPDRPSTNR